MAASPRTGCPVSAETRATASATPRRRAGLPPGGLGQVHVHVRRIVEPGGAGEALCVRAHPRHRDVRRLPRHRPRRPGDAQRSRGREGTPPRRAARRRPRRLRPGPGRRRDGGSGRRSPRRGTSAPRATRTPLPAPSPRAAEDLRPAGALLCGQSPSMPSSRTCTPGSATAKAAGNGYPLRLPPPRQSSTLHECCRYP